MKSLLSILALQTNSVSQEKLAIGLFGLSEGKVWFKVDEHKIKLAEKLVNKNLVDHAHFAVKLISNKIQEEKDQTTNSLFPAKSLFNEEYFLYLSKYSKGLLQFETPKNVAQPLTDELFEKFYQQFINPLIDERVAHHNSQRFYQEVRKQLKNPVFEARADVKYVVRPEKVEGILLEQEIDLISKNGNILTAKAVDFATSKETLIKHLYEYEVMIRSLEAFGKKTISSSHHGAYYLLFNPPARKSPQEKMLNEIRRTKDGLMKLEPVDYLQELELTLEQKHFSKFSEFIEQIDV